MGQAILRQLEQNEWLVPGSRLLVGLSGGVDSVVLLHLLKQLAAGRELTLFAAHLDHAIRTESTTDTLFTQQLCADWNVPLTIERCDVPMLAKMKKISIEMAAREARQAFLLSIAEQLDADYILLAHHRDDQAETFLLRLLRGTGLSGLSGMSQRRGKWLRPLLQVSRQQILEYARDEQLQWVEDSSNQDLHYQRNRIRHQLLPQLREYNPRLDERLDLLSRQQQGEEDFWQQQVDKALPGALISREDGLRLCRNRLLQLHPAERMRVLREAIRQLRGDLQKLTERHLVAVEQLLQSDQSQATLDLPELWVARRYEQLWLRAAPPDVENYCLELSVPGEVRLPDGCLLRAGLDKRSRGETLNQVEFSAEQLVWPLQVRTFRDGDRFSLSGTGGSKKIKDYFIDIKLEKEFRRQVPLVVSGEQIVWIAGVRRSACAPVDDKSGQILRLELVQP